MFKNLKLGTRLIIAFLLVGIVPFAIIGLFSVTKAETALKKQAFNQLEAVREIKKEQIRTYFATIENQMITFAANKLTSDAIFRFKDNLSEFTFENNIDESNLPQMKNKLRQYYETDFKTEFALHSREKMFDGNALVDSLTEEGAAIQYYYIAFNDNEVNKKAEMLEARDLSSYTRDVHLLYHPTFKNFMEEFGFTDIILVEAENGTVVYSVSKRAEFGTRLTDGFFNQTCLAKIFQAIAAAPEPGQIIIRDYSLHEPAFNEPVSFIAAPVFDDDTFIGAAVFQLPLSPLNQIMIQRDGMGKSGETYLVGSDHLMRSDAIDSENFSAKACLSNPTTSKIATDAVKSALKGESGKKITTSYAGEEVLSAYTPIDIHGLKWALITEIGKKEAFEAIQTLKITNTVVGVLGILIIGAIAFIISNSITRPIQVVVNGLDKLAQGEGDLTMRLTARGRDEIADLAIKFNAFMEKLQSMIKEVITGINTLSDSSQQLADISVDMTTSSDQTSAQSDKVASAAEEMSTNMNSVAAAMAQTSTNTETVAKAATEMTTTISEIGKNTTNAHDVTEDAVRRIHQASDQVLDLGQAAQKIDKITETITEISEQTNLLALNATIEAARAGKAGKGFAVVADEIKGLARQTARATLDIQQQINDVQNSTSSTASSIDEISKVIVGINDIVTVISAAVEEQSASTDEIVNNINHTAEGISQVTGHINQTSTAAEGISKEIAAVNHSASEISRSSGQVKISAEDLSSLARSLDELVGKFKV